MNKTELMNSVTRSFNKAGLKIKKHSPEILVVAGVVGGVVSAVMACKATTKVGEILAETKEEIDSVHEVIANEKITEEQYSEQDSKKDLVIIYARAGKKLVKLYGPALALGALSITSILASNNIMRKRNVALAAAYTAVDTGFKEYRGRVVERFGEQLDHELRYNIKAKEIEETVADENGDENTVTKVIHVADANYHNDFSRIYDAGNKGWADDAALNKAFLLRMQDYANDKLRSNGFLFLNDVYEMLGFPKTAAGQIVGWTYGNKKAPNAHGFVDFGLFDVYDENKRDFVNGYEKVVILDFNLDGNILEFI